MISSLIGISGAMAENYSANAVERLGLSAAMIGLVTVVTAVPLARIAQKRVVG